MKKTNKIQQIILIIILAIIGFIMVYPMIWMLISSLKSGGEIINNELTLLPSSLHFENFSNALKAAPFLKYLWNSLWTTTLIVAIQLFFSCLLAYALTQFEFLGRKQIFLIVLTTYMLPSATTYIPSYILLGKLNLTNSLWGLVISSLANVFMIFLLRQNFMSIPKEFIQAARTDGASEWSILWRIVVPISRNTIINSILISFISNFNSYLWPSVLLHEQENFVISVGLNAFSSTQGTFSEMFPILMAGTTLAVVPLLIIYVLLQKYFISGVQNSTLKG